MTGCQPRGAQPSLQAAARHPTPAYAAAWRRRPGRVPSKSLGAGSPLKEPRPATRVQALSMWGGQHSGQTARALPQASSPQLRQAQRGASRHSPAGSGRWACRPSRRLATLPPAPCGPSAGYPPAACPWRAVGHSWPPPAPSACRPRRHLTGCQPHRSSPRAAAALTVMPAAPCPARPLRLLQHRPCCGTRGWTRVGPGACRARAAARRWKGRGAARAPRRCQGALRQQRLLRRRWLLQLQWH